MKRLFAVGTLALMAAMLVSMMGSQALAAEGRVSELTQATPDASRVSKYSSGRGGSVAPSAATAAQAKQHRAQVNGKVAGKATGKVVRAPEQAMSSRASFFTIHDAGSTLLADRDNDGFHSEFRIRFDADAQFGDALVYARLYLRRIGERDWLLYHETDDFWIYGQADDDDYFVTTTLDDGFATGEYDVLIDLYEAGGSGIVATIGPFDTDALGFLPLEEAGLDVPIELGGYHIRGVSTSLIADDDGDGHYSQFRVSFDPDADFDGTFVYARVWVRAQGGTWIQEHVTDDFLVDASGDADVYSFTATWLSGYPTSFYDVQIDLYEASTNALVASAGSERPELARIPLEDQGRDQRPNPPTGSDGGSTSSREHGGGAFGEWFIVALLLLAIGRMRPHRRR